jgi:outer membrane protein assembly factor BamB
MGVGGIVFAFCAMLGEGPWLQNGTGGQGGHQVGPYDLQAVQPTGCNWVRQSAQRGPAAGALAWAALCGEERVANPSDASPALALGRDGLLLAAVPGCAGGWLWALTTEGKVVWSHGFPGGKGCFTDLGLGAPVLGEDGIIFVQSSQGLHALTSDGGLKWSLPLPQGLGPFQVTPALGPDGTLYAAGAHGSLLAVRAEDGQTRWTSEGLSSCGSPVLAGNGTLYALGRVTPAATVLAALDAGTGTRRWTLPLGTAWPYPTLVPAVDREGTVYVAQVEEGQGGRASTDFLAVGPDGKVRWRTKVEGESRCGAVLGADGTVVVCTTQDLQGLEPGTGRALWRYVLPEGFAVLGSTPIVDAEGTIFVATRLGHLLALSAAGRERWRAERPHPGLNPSSLALGPGGRLYYGVRTSSPEADRFYVVALAAGAPAR